MSDHLPDCLMADEPPLGWRCICARLRQAMTNAVDEYSRDVEKVIAERVAEAEQRVEDRILNEGTDRASFAAGVQAAREVVAALHGDNPNVLPRWFKRDALAAIDKLIHPNET